MKTEDNFHIPVLSHEAVKLLINESLEHQIIADGTLGSGGYTKLICENIKPTDKLISIDKDLNALKYAENFLKDHKDKITFVNGNFADLKNILSEISISKITGLVLDLGLSSYQLEAESGFSFMKDSELDMRAYKKDFITAAEILNSYTKGELEEIFENFGEIGNAGRLAKAIADKRKVKKFSTTFDLVNLVNEEYKIGKKNEIDFLAKIFQALRIKVNNELANLENILNDSLDLMEKGGRIVIVSYHSLEDRIVKNFFRKESGKFKESSNPFYKTEVKPKLKVITKKAVMPEREEVKINPRSRSAKLRAAEII